MEQPRVRFGWEKFWLCDSLCRDLQGLQLHQPCCPVSVPTAQPLTLSHNGVCDPVHLMHRIERLSIWKFPALVIIVTPSQSPSESFFYYESLMKYCSSGCQPCTWNGIPLNHNCPINHCYTACTLELDNNLYHNNVIQLLAGCSSSLPSSTCKTNSKFDGPLQIPYLLFGPVFPQSCL